MPIPTLYKGAGPGTHWHVNDARLGGFTSGALPANVNGIIRHITAYSFPSAYLSMSTSFAVARTYALFGPSGPATLSAPGYVYEIDLSTLNPAPPITDPVHGISGGANGPVAHQHNGAGTLIAEVAQGLGAYTACHQCGGGMQPPAVSAEFRALVFAIRDGEVLVNGNVLAGAVINRHSVW